MSVSYGYGYGNVDKCRDDVYACFGKEIEDVTLSTDVLVFRINGGRLHLADEGQSCCERRWMHTDDDLEYYKGARLVGFRVMAGPTVGDADTQFLHVDTDKGTFTCNNYNEHNGYYGGFNIVARWSPIS